MWMLPFCTGFNLKRREIQVSRIFCTITKTVYPVILFLLLVHRVWDAVSSRPEGDFLQERQAGEVGTLPEQQRADHPSHSLWGSRLWAPMIRHFEHSEQHKQWLLPCGRFALFSAPHVSFFFFWFHTTLSCNWPPPRFPCASQSVFPNLLSFDHLWERARI